MKKQEKYTTIPSKLADDKIGAGEIYSEILELLPNEKEKTDVRGSRATSKRLLRAVILALVDLRNAGSFHLTPQSLLEQFSLQNVISLALRKDLTPPAADSLRHFLISIGWNGEGDKQPPNLTEQFMFARCYFYNALELLAKDKPADVRGGK